MTHVVFAFLSSGFRRAYDRDGDKFIPSSDPDEDYYD
jgi:hypothetical protein